MALEPHDLLIIDAKYVIAHSPIPAWAVDSLEATPFVVVRRAHAPKGLAAIGIRGKERNERFAAFLPEEYVVKQIKPEDLAEKKIWKSVRSTMYSSLELAAEIFNHYSFRWGPGGSVGFELATGVETVTLESDLDLIVRAPEPFQVKKAQYIMEELNKCPVKVDVQVETLAGAFSLMEYTRGQGPVLLKTKYGPKLSSIPWENLEALSNTK